MADSASIKREIILLFVGAIISASTAFLTDSFNEKREDKRLNAQKKLELNDQISKDLGKRLFLTYELYRKRRDKDTTLATALLQYKQVKEDWNLKIYSYQSLLNYYYGKSIQEEFFNNIYAPLVQFGQKAEYNNTNAPFEKGYAELQNKNIKFVIKIYVLTEK